MTPPQQQLRDALAGRLPERAIVTDPDAIAPWLVDWRKRYHGASDLLLQPESTEQVAAIVRAAAAAGVPLVPQGGATSMVGGATPPADGSAAILSLRRMNRVRSLEPAANLAVVESGVILADLHAAAAAADRRFPLTLGSRGSATIGGLVSSNAGGTQVLRWGNMRGLVAGLEAVLPDGSVIDDLAALKKDNRGYDLTQLLIGAEGTLGVVTAATLRLAPAITDRAVAWIGLRSPDDALKLLRVLEQRSGVAIEAFELVPRESLDAVLTHIPGTRAPFTAPHPWLVLIEYVGGDAADSLADLLQRGIAMGLAQDAVIAVSEAQAEAFWRIRDSISDAERASGPAMQHDISVPVDAMPGFMTSAAHVIEAAFPGVRASGFGHLGDGNIHFHVSAPKGVDEPRWRAEIGESASRLVHDLVVAAGGSISAEHGIGQMKIDELERLGPPARLHALRAVKRGLDPRGLMNPGKLVRLAPGGSNP